MSILLMDGWIAIKPATSPGPNHGDPCLEGASQTWSWRSVIDCWRSENFVEVWAKQRSSDLGLVKQDLWMVYIWLIYGNL